MLATRSLALRVINALNLEDNSEFKSDEKSKGFSIVSFLGSLIKRESQGLDKGKHKEEATEKSGLIDSYLGRLQIIPELKDTSLVNISFTGVQSGGDKEELLIEHAGGIYR